MTANYISATDLALASLLILVSAGVSLWLKLGLTRRILVAAVRTIVQLSLIGLLLKWIFSADQWYWVLPVIIIMTLIAGHSAQSRSGYRYRGMGIDALVSVWAASWLAGIVGLYAILHVHPWYSPQYVIPILGMILGNCLTAVSLCFNRLTEDLDNRRGHIDMLLSLGAGGWEAYRDTAQKAVIAGMLPTINTMTVIGLVSLPGMMTGQILAGGAPDQAVRYQIVVMFFICAGSAGGCLLCALLVYRKLFDRGRRFCSFRLHRQSRES